MTQVGCKTYLFEPRTQVVPFRIVATQEPNQHTWIETAHTHLPDFLAMERVERVGRVRLAKEIFQSISSLLMLLTGLCRRRTFERRNERFGRVFLLHFFPLVGYCCRPTVHSHPPDLCLFCKGCGYWLERDGRLCMVWVNVKDPVALDSDEVVGATRPSASNSDRLRKGEQGFERGVVDGVDAIEA
jgi:hypothetical protein